MQNYSSSSNVSKRSSFKRGFRIIFNITNLCIAKTILQPYNRVKLLQQLSPLAPLPKTGFFQIIYFIKKQQGLLGLWRGNIADCITVAPSVLVQEFLDPLIRPFIVRHDAHENYWLYLSEELVAEGIITTIRLLLIHPFTVFYTRMAADVTVTYTGYNSFIFSVVKEHGIFGVYRGVTLALLAALIQKAIFILLTEYFRGYTIENISDHKSFISNDDEDEEETIHHHSNTEKVVEKADKKLYEWFLSHICTHFSSIFTYPLILMTNGCMACDITIERCYHTISAQNRSAFFRGLGTHFFVGTMFSFTLVGLTKLKLYYLKKRKNTNNYKVFRETH